MLIAAIVIFALTYVLLLVFPKYRAYIALAAAALCLIIGIVPIKKFFIAVDWNVIMMIGGTMGIVSLFIASKMPSLLADIMIKKIPDVRWAILALSLFAGLISAFMDNVATVLMVAPVALTISKKLNISPVKSIICIAIFSNLEGAATLVGDTTSILLGGYANLDFLDFFVYRGKIGLFFIIQAGALMAALVLFFLFRKEKQKIDINEMTVVKDYFPSVLMVLTVVLLIAASFIPNKPAITNGIICVGLFVIGLIREMIKKKSFIVAKDTLKDIDVFTLLLLMGLFIVIFGLQESGAVQKIGELFVKMSGNNLFVIYTIIVWASVLLSAFIDNIPYIAAMLPVASSIAALMGIDPVILYFGLLSGATLGGNLTPIGASANITALGILKKNGYEVSAKEFMKISVPFTLAAVTTGYLLIWLIWA